MKTLKNKIILYLLAILTVTSIMFVTSVMSKTADADVTTITDYADRFDDTEISSSWTLINNTDTDVDFLDVDYDALIFDADFNTYMSQVCYKPYVMTGACKVELVTYCEGSNNGWFALSAGNPSYSIGMPYSYAAFVMAPTYAHVFLKDGQFIKVDEKYMQTYSPLLEKYNGQLLKTTFDFKDSGEEMYYDIEYTVETMDGTKLGECVYEHIYLQDGYFAVNSQYTDIALVSFKIFEGGNEIENCDFSTSSILYPTSGSQNSNWVVASDFTSSTLKIGVVASLDVSKAGTALVYNSKYERPVTKELEELYYISADVKTADMGVGVASGFEIAKADKDQSGIFMGLTKDDKGKFYLVAFDGVNQKKVEIQEKTVDGKSMELVVYYDNTLILSLGGTCIEFVCDSVEGYFGLTTLDFYDCFAGEKGAKFDNFEYKRNTYKSVQSSDNAINFEGTKTTYFAEIDQNLVDYYISKKDWRLSSDIIVPMYFEGVSNSAITFSGLNASAYFGPTSPYTNFIVRFDITILENATEISQSKFGLQFGMADTESSVEESYFLGFQTYPTAVLDDYNNVVYKPYTYVVSQGAKLTTGASYDAFCSDSYKTQQINIFKNYVTYNVMYVAENGSVKVYMKEQSEADSVFEILRGEITGVNTQGYLQILGLNYAQFDLDNFSIINLDYNMTSTEYNGNGYEILRADFRQADELNEFSLIDAEYADTTLIINEGGSIVSSKTLKNEIFRFKTKSLTGDLVFEQGELKVIIAESGDNIVVMHNNKIRNYSLDEKIDFDGALFELYKMGNSLVISYVNQNQPVSAIKHNQCSVTVDNIFENEIKLYADGGSLELLTLSVFDLKPSITIDTRDYDPDVDYVNIWAERPSIQELSGCNSNLEGIIIILPIVMAIASVIVIRRKKDEKNK